jgi:hypothetical protein
MTTLGEEGCSGWRRSGQEYLRYNLACGICYEFFTILTSTTLAAKTTDA